jgi:hypothetical protein
MIEMSKKLYPTDLLQQTQSVLGGGNQIIPTPAFGVLTATVFSIEVTSAITLEARAQRLVDGICSRLTNGYETLLGFFTWTFSAKFLLSYWQDLDPEILSRIIRLPWRQCPKEWTKGTISIKCWPMRPGLFPGLPIMRGFASTHKFCPFFVGDRINDRRSRFRNFDLSKNVGFYQFLNQRPLPKRWETNMDIEKGFLWQFKFPSWRNAISLALIVLL